MSDDHFARVNREYDEALMAYEDALASRNGEQRAEAEARLSAATAELSRAQSERVAARKASPVTFATVLNDPAQQLDPKGAIWASIREYQNATSGTPSADDHGTPRAPDTAACVANPSIRDQCERLTRDLPHIPCPCRRDDGA